MHFSTYSIRHPIPAILLFILLSIAGALSFHRMVVQESPDIDFPYITVTSTLPGASPPQLETEVARKIEASVATIAGVRHISTSISDSTVQTTIEFRLEKDITEAMNDTRDAVSRIRSELPPQVLDPVFTKASTTGKPTLTYTVSSERLDEEALSWFVDNKVIKKLLAAKGVGKVTRVGGGQREIRIELDPVRLAALDISVADVSRQLQRVQTEASGGRADVSGARQSVRTIAAVANVAEVAAMELALANGRRIRIGQVARVVDTLAERTEVALLDGKRVVGFEVSRSTGASEIEVGATVRKAMAELRAHEPAVRIDEISNRVDASLETYDGAMAVLYEGAALAIIVVWLFLRDWRATLIAAAALPLSILPTFLVMYLLGFTLNLVTLLSLALVVGVLIDDAIVEIENIIRHLRMGKSPWQAALDAADEIGLAVVATTFTLVAVFLPTAFMSGIIGKFFKQFGWTEAVAVTVSLLVARLLTPMMAAYLLKPDRKDIPDGALMARYLQAVRWCLRRRGTTAALATVFFIASLALVPLLPSEFIPAKDRSQTEVTLELAPGSTLAETEAKAEMARRIIGRDKDVLQVYTHLGAEEGRYATLSVKLAPRAGRARSQADITMALRDMLEDLPGARVTVGSGASGESMSVLLSGDDAQELAAAAHAIERDLRTIDGIGNISSTISLVRPEVIVTPDLARAADMGVTAADIGDTMRIASSGDYDQQLAKLNLADRQVPIRVALPAAARTDLGLLGQLRVPSKNGSVALASVARLHLDSGAANIERYDRKRRVIITAETNGLPLGLVLRKLDQFPSASNLPPSVTRGELGDAEAMRDMFSGFALAMLTGIACVYAVLVLLFRSFMQPLTILVALPLSIGGAFAALLLSGSSLSMPTLIGLLMLMGIAVKNSILLVDYALIAQRERGMARAEALVDACHKRSRPIIMTSIAMGAGMLPAAVGLGGDASFRGPMAIAVLGGLVTSTFLSLLVVPVVFTFVDDVRGWTARRFGGHGAGEAPAPGAPA